MHVHYQLRLHLSIYNLLTMIIMFNTILYIVFNLVMYVHLISRMAWPLSHPKLHIHLCLSTTVVFCNKYFTY